MDRSEHVSFRHCEPWNKGKLVGQKSPLRLKEIWAIRIRLQLAQRTRELALFNLAVDSKLRSCDLVRLRVRDITHGDQVATRAIVMQQKTQRPVQFEITEHTRESLADWVRCANRQPQDYLFPSRLHASPHLSTRQYARIVRGWVQQIGLNPARMEPPRCAAPRLRSSTAGQRISGPCSFCSGIQSSRVLCVTSASRLMMPLRWLSRLRCRQPGRWAAPGLVAHRPTAQSPIDRCPNRAGTVGHEPPFPAFCQFSAKPTFATAEVTTRPTPTLGETRISNVVFTVTAVGEICRLDLKQLVARPWRRGIPARRVLLSSLRP